MSETRPTVRRGEPVPVPTGPKPLRSVSIILPALNEEIAVADTIACARAEVHRLGLSCEVILVDGGSSDGTVEVATRAGATVLHQRSGGYGSACVQGMAAASGDALVILEADGTYDAAELNRFIEPLRAGYDLVQGTRRNGEMKPRSMGFLHTHLLEPMQTWLVRKLFGLRVSDMRCGFRALRAEALAWLNLDSLGMDFHGDFLVQSAQAGLDTVEVPVTFRPRPNGERRRAVGASWEVVRQLLLLSPLYLFAGPGALLASLGLLIEIVLMMGPVRLGALTFDYHLMFVGSALAVLGVQLLLLGLFAKTYALIHQPGLAGRRIQRFHERYTLNRGLALGLCLGATGLLVDVWIATRFVGTTDPGAFFAVKPATFALTLMVMGAEVVFGSFFLSVLRGTRQGRV